jgi:hypothetical protein
MPKSGQKGKKPDSSVLEREIIHAMHDEDWLAPETEEAVKRAEAQLTGEKISIPTSFEHPRALLQRSGKIRVIRRSDRSAESDEAREDLARAAREGGTISPEIEERMKMDRDRAENKKKR